MNLSELDLEIQAALKRHYGKGSVPIVVVHTLCRIDRIVQNMNNNKEHHLRSTQIAALVVTLHEKES